MRLRFGVVLAALVAMATLLPMQLHAQTFFGSVVGTVTDASGAVIPGATVTITNLGTSESRTEKTGGEGEYRFVNLVPTNYKVTVEAANYKRFASGPITVEVGNTSRIDATMTVGATTETVEVTTQTPLLQTDSGTMGAQVEGKTVTEMPLNGRNPLNLIALAPGVVVGAYANGGAGLNGGGGGSPGGSHSTAIWTNYVIGGGIVGMNADYLDGVTIDTLGNLPSLVPTQDAIQEFKLATDAVSAEFGHFSGGVVEFTTKSGSNAWHGSAYEYVRNKYFNANFFFNKYQNVPRPEWNQNQYGVVASGPVIKDKLFALFTWEHFVARLGKPTTTNVPTAAMQAGFIPGDLSGNAIVKALCPGVSYDTSTQYPKTTDISACVDKTAAVLKAAFPAPTNTNAAGNNNYYSVPVVGNGQNQYNGRGDWAISSKQRLFARYTYWSMADTSLDGYGSAGGFKTGNGFTTSTTNSAVLGDTYTFNPTTILDVRLGYTRFNYNASEQNGGTVDETQFGPAWAALAPQMTYHGLPGIHVTGKYNFEDFRSMDDVDQNTYNNYSIAASVTKIAGAHTMKAGTELRLMDRINLGLGTTMDPAGFFTFNNSATLIPDEWAAFLLGFAANNTFHTASTIGAYQYMQGYYLTDDWMVNRKLTLNLGLRYDLPGAVSERRDKATVLLPYTKDPYTGVTGTLALVNSALYAPRNIQKISHSQVQPRVGFAYRLANNTTVRGGYGLSYTPTNALGQSPTASPVGVASTSWVNTGAAPIYLLANPLPAAYYPNGINQPVGRSNPAFMQSYIGQSISGPNPNEPYSYVQQWNFAVARQLKSALMVEAAYVGSTGTHLPAPAATNYGLGWSINQLDKQYYPALNAMLTGFGPSPTTAQIKSLIALGQSERPYPAYQALANTMHNATSSSYHSLQIRVEKRFRNGGLISGNYTWSKSISNSSQFTYALIAPQDYNNPRGEYSVVASNIPNNAIISYVLNLPFGKGEKYGANAHGVAGALISGWSANGITSFQDGFPQALHSQANYLVSNWGAGVLRPNYTAGCNKKISGSAFERWKNGKWFNTDCFANPGPIEFGNQVPIDDKIRQQGLDNWDITAAKKIALHESLNMVFKAEFFNTFNFMQFAYPGTTVGGGNATGGPPGPWGAPNSQNNSPRLIQLSLRLNY